MSKLSRLFASSCNKRTAQGWCSLSPSRPAERSTRLSLTGPPGTSHTKPARLSLLSHCCWWILENVFFVSTEKQECSGSSSSFVWTFSDRLQSMFNFQSFKNMFYQEMRKASTVHATKRTNANIMKFMFIISMLRPKVISAMTVFSPLWFIISFFVSQKNVMRQWFLFS